MGKLSYFTTAHQSSYESNRESYLVYEVSACLVDEDRNISGSITGELGAVDSVASKLIPVLKICDKLQIVDRIGVSVEQIKLAPHFYHMVVYMTLYRNKDSSI